MTVSAWVFMSIVWAVILVMVGYCFFKLLTSARPLGGPDETLGSEDSSSSETGITKLPGD